MPSDTLIPDKKALRTAAATVRSAAHAAQRDRAPSALVFNRFPVLPAVGANVVSGFYPYQEEIDTRPLLSKLAGEGWVTCLPIVLALGQPLEFRRWYVGEPTIPGKWDIPRPPHEALLVEPDVLLVPMLAFDRYGYRLGYGGGFYDRTLAKLRAQKKVVAIGIAYAGQQVVQVPHGGHDQKLDYVMTEEGLITCD